MAPPREQSDSTQSLPRPELNPLLNPVLAENMGKWAEVYFTSPPEKREEAVEELLRLLESGEPIPENEIKGPPPVAISVEAFPEDQAAEPLVANRDARPLRHCDACGHSNPTTHQFCGMCGEKLIADGASGESQDREVGSSDMFSDSPRELESDAVGAVSGDEAYSAAVDSRNEQFEQGDELAHFRRISHGTLGASGDSPDWNMEPPSSRSPRIFVGAAVAMMLLAVGYVAWRASQSTQAQKPAVVATTATNEPSPAMPAPQKTETAAATPAPVEPASNPPVAAADTKTPAKATNNVPTPLPEKQEPAAAPGSLGNGMEELALAQRYLSGGTGLNRNSAEAAQWLWKSIAKHNSEATILLADLYLKGDGVTKSCDQARVLLDSAARKGVSGAGERLRNLQAFGCE